jgi:hypothetical protein
LAARLREEGLDVIGFGEQKTPKPFVKACDKFIYTELLRNDAEPAEPESPSNVASAATPTPATTTESKPIAQPAPTKVKPQKVPVDFIAKVIDDNSDEDGWCHLGLLGSNISKLRSDFDSRMYGFKKLSDLIKAQNGRFELQVLEVTSTGGQALAVRNRKPSK